MEAYDYNWDASSGNTDYLLSPAWVYNKIAAFDYGSMPVEAADLLLELGTSTLSTMPYNDNDVNSWGNEPAWREAPNHRISDYTLITYTGNPTINIIKSFLDSEIPVTFGIDAHNFDYGLDDISGDYILSSSEYDPSSYLNHAQCFVGYDDAITENGDVGAFRVVNSWGSGWMDAGFYWLTYDAFKEFAGAINQQIIYYTDLIDYEPSLISTWEFNPAPTRMDDIVSLGVGPYGAPLDTRTFHYDADTSNLFPEFMALDISEFQPYYDANNDVSFYLEVGPSFGAGIISSFRVERYVSGSFEEITPESFDVPQSTPGYVKCSFMELDHELGVSLEIPSDPEFGNSYLINATVNNIGINTETNVELYLYLDEVEVNSTTFINLLPDAEGTIDYLWTPMEYRTYNLTVYAPPVSGEACLSNNMVTELIRITSLRNYTMTPDYPYTWIDASGGTQLLLGDDDFTMHILPFDFQFYDAIYSSIYLGSNGYLSFTDFSPSDYSNDPIPSSDPDNTYLIAPFWDDLDPSFSGSIYIDTDYSTYWVAEWLNIYQYDQVEVGTFEIILYNTGEIIFSYYEINYIDPYGGYTCGLNYGDLIHYNSYQGLDTSTSLFSIHFSLEPLGPPKPDLTDRGESYSTFTPTSVQPGVTRFDVWCDVENIGTEASGEFNVSYYASLDTTITESDFLLGNDTLSSIASEDYANSNWSGIFPIGIPDDTYYIGWIIDSTDDVNESNDNNNVFYETSYTLLVSSSPAQPDLTDRDSSYSDFTPTTVVAGVTPFNVWCDIENIDADPSGAFIVSYYASSDTIINDSDFLLGTEILPSIASGDYANSSWLGTFPIGLPNGAYYIGWIIDSNDNVDESDEKNNVFYETSYQLNVINKPDLTDRGESYSSFTPTSVHPGVTTFNVWCDVENIGTATSGEFNVSYYASLDTTITESDFLLGTDNLSSIASGNYADSNWSGIFPIGLPLDTYYIGWIIDSTDDVNETNENNNLFYETSNLLIVVSFNIFFQEDFEGALTNWVAINGLWHLTDIGSSWPDPCHSYTHSIWFGDEISGTYDTGFREYGYITSIPIDLSGESQAYLEFFHWKEVEGFGGYDYSSVFISTDGFTWERIYFSYGNLGPWNFESIDISAYCGSSSVQIRFYFDTIDELYNSYRGWLVDDIKIVSESSVAPPAPVIPSNDEEDGDGRDDDEDDVDILILIIISLSIIGAIFAATFITLMIVKKKRNLSKRDRKSPSLPTISPTYLAKPQLRQTISKPLCFPKFCTNCGAALNIGKNFCTQCGEKINYY